MIRALVIAAAMSGVLTAIHAADRALAARPVAKPLFVRCAKSPSHDLYLVRMTVRCYVGAAIALLIGACQFALTLWAIYGAGKARDS